jgi:hypothetical protein
MRAPGAKTLVRRVGTHHRNTNTHTHTKYTSQKGERARAAARSQTCTRTRPRPHRPHPVPLDQEKRCLGHVIVALREDRVRHRKVVPGRLERAGHLPPSFLVRCASHGEAGTCFVRLEVVQSAIGPPFLCRVSVARQVGTWALFRCKKGPSAQESAASHTSMRGPLLCTSLRLSFVLTAAGCCGARRRRGRPLQRRLRRDQRELPHRERDAARVPFPGAADLAGLGPVGAVRGWGRDRALPRDGLALRRGHWHIWARLLDPRQRRRGQRRGPAAQPRRARVPIRGRHQCGRVHGSGRSSGTSCRTTRT